MRVGLGAMVQVSPRLWRAARQPWFSSPACDHLAHFYQHERVLIACLLEYVYAGLSKHEACVIVATPSVLIGLQKGLRRRGLDLSAALADKLYVTYDADDMLARIMDGRTLNTERFYQHVGQVIATSVNDGRPVRVYGELVARLIDAQNITAALEVETLWNELINDFNLSVYCAYPESVLVRNTNDDVSRESISSAHTFRLRT